MLAASAACGQADAVQELYQKAIHDQQVNQQDAAVEDYRELLKLDPNIAAAYNNLGRLFYNSGQYSDAVSTLRKGLALDATMAPANIMLGASLLQLGQFQDAVEPLQSGLRVFPSDRFALITLTRVLVALSHPSEATSYLDRIIASDPKDQEAWYLLGKVHLQLSQQAFAKVQSIDLNSPIAEEMAGEIMESMQNTQGAVEAYKKALAASPDSVSALDHLGNLYWSTGDWAHAHEFLTRQLAKQPQNCIAHWKLASALDEVGESPERGMAEINRALQICPALPQAHAERARLFLRAKRPAEALADLDVAEKAAPDESSLQQLFAQAYLGLGDKARAATANRRYQQLEAAQRTEKEQHAARVDKANR